MDFFDLGSKLPGIQYKELSWNKIYKIIPALFKAGMVLNTHKSILLRVQQLNQNRISTYGIMRNLSSGNNFSYVFLRPFQNVW